MRRREPLLNPFPAQAQGEIVAGVQLFWLLLPGLVLQICRADGAFRSATQFSLLLSWLVPVHRRADEAEIAPKS